MPGEWNQAGKRWFLGDSASLCDVEGTATTPDHHCPVFTSLISFMVWGSNGSLQNNIFAMFL